MHPNEIPPMEAMTKGEKLKAYLKYKENVDRDILDMFTRGDITPEVYQKLIQSGEDGYREFLTLLSRKEGEGQLDLDFNQNKDV